MTSIRGDLDKMEPFPSNFSIDRLSRNSLKNMKSFLIASVSQPRQ